MAACSEPDKLFEEQQYLRLKTEEKNQWISSEDLRTDQSSDEEKSPNTSKKSRNKRNRENRALRFLTSAKDDGELTLKTSTAQNVKFDKCAFNAKSVAENCNMENQWRPKRGSLKLPSLTSNNYQVTNRNAKYERNMDEMLESVNLLDKKIDEMNYKIQLEKEERLEVQKQINAEFEEVTQNEHFFSKLHKTDEIEPRPPKNKKQVPMIINNRKNFIERNILSAKNIQMANTSLTDEEKQRMECLLIDIDLMESDDPDVELPEEILNDILINPFVITKDDQKKMQELDAKLAGLTDTQQCRLGAKETTLERINAKLQALAADDQIDNQNYINTHSQ